MYISLNNLFTGMIYLILIAVLIFGFIVLLKLNKVITITLEILENNKKNINATCNELPIISKNIIEITDNIKDISEVATEFTADAIVTKENIVNNYEIVKEVLRILKSVFLK